jgi:rhodanese-related sulfurtransferase
MGGQQITTAMGPNDLLPGARSASGDLLTPQQLLRLQTVPAYTGQGSPQLIIDLRSRSRYRQRHIPGSHSIPSGWLISGEPPDGDLILVGESTLHSAATIEHLHAQGYARKIRHLEGGFEAWQQQELPMASHQRAAFPFPGNRWRLGAGATPVFRPWGRSRFRAGA